MTMEKSSEVTAAAALATLCLRSPSYSSSSSSSSDEETSKQPKIVTKTTVAKDEEPEIVLPRRFNKNGRLCATPFPLKLMKVLSNKRYRHVITWVPNGKSFVILDPKAFVSTILPQHFKSAKYASFTRKLHRWGFVRLPDGNDLQEFSHARFQRGRIDLAEHMTCKPEQLSSTAAPAPAAKVADTPTKASSPPSRRSITSGRLPPEYLSFPFLSSPTDQEAFKYRVEQRAIELETMRFKACLKAAARSRKLLSMMRRAQGSSLLPYRSSLPTYDLSFASATSLLRHPKQLPVVKEPWLGPYHPMSKSLDIGLGELSCFKNVQGAKTA